MGGRDSQLFLQLQGCVQSRLHRALHNAVNTQHWIIYSALSFSLLSGKELGFQSFLIGNLICLLGQNYISFVFN